MYKVELERKPTPILKYKMLIEPGKVDTIYMPTYANQITLDYKKEYGDLRYTDYFIHRPTNDAIGIFTKTYNENYDINYYLKNQIIPAVENIFEVFKINLKEVLEGKKQTCLGDY